MKTYKLESPIIFGDETIEEIQYPEKIITQYIENLEFPFKVGKDAMMFVANCTRQPFPIIRLMELSDFTKLNMAIQEGMGKKGFTKTGKN